MPLNPNRSSLPDLFELLKKDVLLSLNCHAIGTVQSFDPATQRVRATINYKKNFVTGPKPSDVETKDYPLLVDCPAVVLSGGTSSLTFPISAGDTCLLLFNDRDYDTWLSSGQVTAPKTARLHSLSDGIALVGLRSAQNVISGYDTTRAVLRNGSTRVGVGAAKVRIENGSTTLLTALQTLTGALKSFATTAGGSTVDPTLVSAATALSAAIDSAASALGGLLE